MAARDAQDARRRPSAALGARRARSSSSASLAGRGASSPTSSRGSRPPPDALAAVVFTSGATGPAKGVLYDQRTMAAQFTAVRECYAIGADDRLVAAFAPFALYGPALGIPVAVPDCDITKPATLRAAGARRRVRRGRRDDRLRGARRARGRAGVERDAHRRRAPEALGRLRLVLSAGAPVPQRTLEAFGRLAPAAELHTPYGMTEVLSVADIDLESSRPSGRVAASASAARSRASGSGSSRCPVATARAARSSSARRGSRSATTGSGPRTTAPGRSTSTASSGIAPATSATSTPRGACGSKGGSRTSSATVDGPVTPVPLEIAVSGGDRACARAVTGVGPAGLRAGRRGRRATTARRVSRRARRPRGARGASRAAARRGAHRPEAAGRHPPQLEDRPHAARPLGRRAARRRLGAEARLMRVLVTGGSGLLGRTTCAALAARGHEVVALQRHRSDELACEQVLADVRDADAVAAAAAGCDAVIHGAARVGVVGSREEFRRANVGGTEAVVAACRAAGVARLVVVSSPSVGYESTPTVGAGAAAPITSRQRPLLVLGVEGRGRARSRSRRTTPRWP